MPEEWRQISTRASGSQMLISKKHRTDKNVCPTCANKSVPVCPIASSIIHCPVYRKVMQTGEPAIDVMASGATPADPDQVRHFLASYYPLKTPDGVVWGLSSIVQDVTERKRAEQELRESERRFRELAENIQEVFWLHDLREGRFIYMSPTFEAIFGISRKAVCEDRDSWLKIIHLPRRGCRYRRRKFPR